MSDFVLELQGYKLTTAQIYYRLPDHPSVLQEFIWQHYDLAPKFPKLYGFLEYWEAQIDGELHSVYVARKELIKPNDSKFYDVELLLQ